jgi:monoamine oxidase
LWPGGLTQVAGRPPAYAELLKPEGPIVFAGEHLSYQPAWQEGAVLSAFEAMKLVQSMSAERQPAKAV